MTSLAFGCSVGWSISTHRLLRPAHSHARAGRPAVYAGRAAGVAAATRRIHAVPQPPWRAVHEPCTTRSNPGSL